MTTSSVAIMIKAVQTARSTLPTIVLIVGKK